MGRRSLLALTGAAAAGTLIGTGTVGAALDEYANVIVVDGRTASSPTTYEFDVAERVAPIDEIDNTNDSIDGTHVEGSVDGTVNAYEFDSEIVRLSTDGPADVAFGSDAAALVPETAHTLTIRSPSHVEYEFTATGQITKRLDDGDDSAERGNDSVWENADGTWSATGSTGNGYGDSYDVDGEVTDWTATGDYSLTWDGVAVTADELTGSDGTTDDGSTDDSTDTSTDDDTSTAETLGGGDGYSATVAPSSADYSVGSASSLEDAFGAANAGDVVYLTDDVSLSSTVTVPDGVTLASDRGIDGASGATIVADSEFIVLEAGSDSRITGLRMDGPLTGYEDWDGYPAGAGIECRGSGIEIDNCELFGFSYAAVEASNDEHVHHCDIHDNPQDGLGYGVTCTGGHPIIEYNTFDANRHSVAGSGSGGYTVRYNHFGAETVDHVIDMHEPGGTNMVIHHNTVEATDHMQDDGETEAVYIRDEVSDGATIENNWFHHPALPSDGGDPGEAVRTPFDSWSDANVSLSGNAYGTSEPADDVGAPR